jgi:hypothetical protein
MRWCAVATTTHLAEAHVEAGLGELPRRFRSGEAAADNVDVVLHRLPD